MDLRVCHSVTTMGIGTSRKAEGAYTAHDRRQSGPDLVAWVEDSGEMIGSALDELRQELERQLAALDRPIVERDRIPHVTNMR